MKPAFLPSTALVLTGSVALALGFSHFAVDAKYEPPAKGQAQGAVAVYFSPTERDLKLNEHPPARLVLDPAQTVLEDKQPPAPKMSGVDPDKVKGLDLSKPVRFPVALRAAAPKGEHRVKASVTYFYCSTREAWCRRGKENVEFTVSVP